MASRREEKSSRAASSGLQNVDSPNFPGEEEKVLEYWKKIDAFQTSLKLSEGKPEYTFYDGPPFATGLPHYGHILAGTIKDIVTRFAHQTGHHVSRRFGWDCHGLPVEYEIDQKLGVKSRDDVLKMGVDVYNDHCRSIVQRYAGEWETRITRLGRWIDFKNDYKTMDLKFMESVWWVFGQLHSKDLVYRGFKVMPYSTGCTTPLSNFEAGLNYKDVRDPAVVVSFPLKDQPDVSFLAWTTTPWTLPSNLALCVNPTMKYVKVLDKTSGAKWILAEKRLVQLFPTAADVAAAKGETSAEEDGIVKDALISFDDVPEDKPRVGKKYEVLETYVGTDLVGKKYEPLFNFYGHLEAKGAFRVVADDYVLDSSGTGIVHQAPAFGEDDYRVCEKAGVITKGKDLPCPVNADGVFTDEVKQWAGLNVKKADPSIMADLRARGRLIHHGTIIHSYPFCWRSDQPLIYKAVPSWFVAVEKIKEKLLATNAQTYWVPPNIKDGRFVNWLKDARDWAISRNRFWGTPLPIWISDDEKEIKVVSSVEELQRLSGVANINDLHKDKVDKITLPSSRGPSFGRLKRVEEVFDCWFESGSMPYGQLHYPFENKEVFDRGFPADFIAEGLDQTRGWFYTLMVLSTALFDKPAFKNLIVNGLVLADDGKKMSKRLKNYPDPQLIVDLNGADALRLYLINSPVVKAEPLRFQKDGVRDVVKAVFLPWFNAYRFLVENAKRYETQFNRTFMASTNLGAEVTHIMDKWILASLQDLIAFVHQEMAAYRLYTVTPELLKFIDKLTNWYVRGNRSRARGNNGEADARLFLTTLFEVIYSLIRLMAPFTPFLVENMYQNLKVCLPASERADSVHYVMVPKPNAAMAAPDIVRAVRNMQEAVLLARAAREQRSVSLKRPIAEVIIVHSNQAVLDDIKSLDSYVREEVNVRTVKYTTERGQFFGAVARPNKRVLGARLGAKSAPVLAAVAALDNRQVSQLQKEGKLTVTCADGFQDTVLASEVDVELVFTGDKTSLESASGGEMLVVIDITPYPDLLEDWLARGVVARVQKLVKDSKVRVTDAVELFYETIPTPPKPLHERLSHAAPAYNATVADANPKKEKPKQQQQQKHSQAAAKKEAKEGAEPKKEKAAKGNAKAGESKDAAAATPAPAAAAAAPAKAEGAKKEKVKKGDAPKAEAKAEAPKSDAPKSEGAKAKKEANKKAPEAAAKKDEAKAADGQGEGEGEEGDKKVSKSQLKKLAKANEKAAAVAAKESSGAKKQIEYKLPSLGYVISKTSMAIATQLRRHLHPVQHKPQYALVLGTVDADVEGQWVRLWVTRPSLSFNKSAIESTLSGAGAPPTASAAVISYFASKDYPLFKERLTATGDSKSSVVIEGKTVAFSLGTHLYWSVSDALGIAPLTLVSPAAAAATVETKAQPAAAAASAPPAKQGKGKKESKKEEAAPAVAPSAAAPPAAAQSPAKAPAKGKKGK